MYSLVDEFYFKENIQIGSAISIIQFVYESLEILRHLGVECGDFKLDFFGTYSLFVVLGVSKWIGHSRKLSKGVSHDHASSCIK